MRKSFVISVLVAAFTSYTAIAGTAGTSPAAKWVGKGIRFNHDKANAQPYGLEVVIDKSGADEISKVTVTPAAGSEILIECRRSDGKQGWSLDCTNGKGGGYCFAHGMCQTYVADATGRAYATTISMDGPTSMRILRTELENGNAVAFYQETLQKH